MPTPTGLPKAGDLLIQRATGNKAEVVERRGTGIDYSLVCRALNFTPSGNNRVMGHPASHFLIVEAAFWVRPQAGEGSWKLTTRAKEKQSEQFERIADRIMELHEKGTLQRRDILVYLEEL